MWWRVKISLSLRLILHLELGKQRLLKLSLLCRTYRLTKFLLLSLTELVKEVLIEVISILPLLFVLVIGPVGACLLEARVMGRLVLVELT